MQNPGGGGYNTGGQQGQGGGGGQPPQQQQSGGKPTGMYGYPHGGMQQNMPMHGGGGAGGGKPQTQHGMGGGMPSQQQHQQQQQQQQSQQQQYPGPGGGGSGSGTAPGIMPGMNPAQQMYPSGSMQPRGGGAGPGGPGGYPGQTPYHHYMPGGMSGGPGSGYPTGQYGSQQQGAQQQQQPIGTTSGMPPQYPAGSQGVPSMAGQQQRGGGMAGTMSGQESGMNPAAQYNVGPSGGGHLPATGYLTSAAAPPTSNPMQATVKTEPLQQQHAQHAPTTAPSTAAYAAPPQYMPHPMQQMPQHPMFHPGPPGAQTHAQTREELKRAMTPSPYPESILNNLKIYNVANLCTIGRELVHELNVRTSLLCSSLKQISEKRSTVPSTGDPEVILEYCQHILKKLLEIRLRIEKLAPGTRMDPEDFIERMTDMTPPEKPEMLAKEEERFETHRRKLVALNADMKLLDWMASVDDPHYLKKTDRQIEKS